MDLEAEYNNRARVPEHPDIIAGWQRDAAAFRAAAGGELDLAYGDHARQRLDVFRSKDDQAGPMAMFVHGGYWVNFDKDHFSHMARGLEFHGVPMAVPSYRLAPEVKIRDIIEDMRRCCLFLWQRYSRRLVVAGHSAGGHLAAAMLATDWKSLGAPEDLVTAGLGISGVYDLRPLIPIAMNASLRLDEPEARAAARCCGQPPPAPSRFGSARPKATSSAARAAPWSPPGKAAASMCATARHPAPIILPSSRPWPSPSPTLPGRLPGCAGRREQACAWRRDPVRQGRGRRELSRRLVPHRAAIAPPRGGVLRLCPRHRRHRRQPRPGAVSEA
jgi:arylformamidase